MDFAFFSNFGRKILFGVVGGTQTHQEVHFLKILIVVKFEFKICALMRLCLSLLHNILSNPQYFATKLLKVQKLKEIISEKILYAIKN